MLHAMRFPCILLIALAGCVDHAKHSVALYEAGDYAGAARAADEGLAAHPDDDALWAMQVRSELALGDADAVAKAYAGYQHARGDDDRRLLRDLAEATLEQALASPSAQLEIHAIDAIASLRYEDLADEVIQKLGSDDDRVAATAAVAVLHAHPQAPQILDSMLRSELPEARRIAVEGVGKKVGKPALDDLEQAAGDPDPHVRAAALRWLGMLRDPSAADACSKHLQDPDEDVRAAAASALARLGTGDLAAAGKQALADSSLAVRLAGVELLAAAHADGELAQLAGGGDPVVALAAALAVKRTHPELVAPAIARAIAAADWTQRADAANQLVEALGRAAALPIAQRLAGDPAIAVRLAAARVLAHAGDPDDARRVFTAALATDHAVQAAADLGALGDPQGLDALSRFVRDARRTPAQRAEAVEAHLAAHHVTPGLVAALADPNGLVRVEAAAVIGELAK